MSVVTFHFFVSMYDILSLAVFILYYKAIANDQKIAIMLLLSSQG